MELASAKEVVFVFPLYTSMDGVIRCIVYCPSHPARLSLGRLHLLKAPISHCVLSFCLDFLDASTGAKTSILPVKAINRAPYRRTTNSLTHLWLSANTIQKTPPECLNVFSAIFFPFLYSRNKGKNRQGTHNRVAFPP